MKEKIKFSDVSNIEKHKCVEVYKDAIVVTCADEQVSFFVIVNKDHYVLFFYHFSYLACVFSV